MSMYYYDVGNPEITRGDLLDYLMGNGYRWYDCAILTYNALYQMASDLVMEKAFPFPSPLGTIFKHRKKVAENPSIWKYVSLEEKREQALYNFDNPTEEMLMVPYKRAEYNKLFPEGTVTNFFETVKLGEHQFERLEIKDGGARKNYIGAMYQTLKRPTCIIDDIDGEGRHTKLYIKSFRGEDKNRASIAVIATFNGIPISVSFGLRKPKSARRKIENASTIYYVTGDI